MVFESSATNLVVGDTNARSDVFVRDTQAGTTSRVSVGPGGAEGNAESIGGSVSGDGRFVAFVSGSTNFDVSGGIGLFVHDRQSGVTSPLETTPLTGRRGWNLEAPYEWFGRATTT